MDKSEVVEDGLEFHVDVDVNDVNDVNDDDDDVVVDVVVVVDDDVDVDVDDDDKVDSGDRATFVVDIVKKNYENIVELSRQCLCITPTISFPPVYIINMSHRARFPWFRPYL